MSHSITMLSTYSDYSHTLLPSSPSPLFPNNNLGLHPLTNIAISPSGFQLSPIALTPRRGKTPIPPPAPEAPDYSPLKTPRLSFSPAQELDVGDGRRVKVDERRDRDMGSSLEFLGPHFGYYGRHLPHFHPPKYSRRLRNLVSKRRKPLQISLLPMHERGSQRWARLETDSEYDKSSAGGSFIIPEKFQWVLEPRVLLFFIILVVVLAIAVTAIGVGAFMRG